MAHVYKLAGLNIRIDSVYGEIHRLCAGYSADGESADIELRTLPEDIEFEREKSAREDMREGIPVRRFSDEYLETLAVYRKIAELMPSYDTVLFHGSCVAVDGKGYLFTAKSGTGKSTHTRLWRELLGERAVMVNDDKPLIKVSGGGAVIFGTPWDGKHHLSSNVSVPLAALCVLERAENNRIETLAPAQAYPMLLRQVYRPADSGAMTLTLSLLDRMAKNTGLYRLGCNMDISAAELAYNAMKKA